MKRNITVSVDEEAYCRARAWAALNQTSISSIFEYYIQYLPGIPMAREAVAALKQRSRGVGAYANALHRMRQEELRKKELRNEKS